MADEIDQRFNVGPIQKLGEGQAYIPQFGPTIGAKVYVGGQGNVPQPTAVGYEPPQQVGRSTRGKPFYQGLPTLVLKWAHMDIDGFQALSTLFFPTLNSPEGPVVDITWPSPYEAGRYVVAKAYMEWPSWGEWSELYIHDVVVRFSSFSLQGQGIFIEGLL